MSKLIDSIYIRNFKSIEECEIRECKRINLFIGRPNVGKSNIVEALSAFSVSYLKENASKKLSNLIRVENESELFYNGRWENEALIQTSIGSCTITFHPKEFLYFHININGESFGARINEKLNVTALATNGFAETNIKRYNFKTDVVYKKGHSKYLIPPFGQNLLSIIENYPKLKKDIISLFSDYQLEIAFDKSSQTMKIIQNNRDGIFLIPYNSIADTLQRIIFYKAAITSNNDSVLLFEEPEAHSFPPYMSHLTQEMIYKKDNQYFIATHSPFILNDLLENAQEELAVFNVDFRDKQTVVKALSRDELHEILQNGVDIFTNNEMYL
ncbi:AAA family ATPase [Foetidibacter luteolus]|uniref:AAA family ATPase n=1 Tax=Foetidibacter luteolus TaxID=2608880 RepID=UPI00129B5D95|nr:AAA family ATPase [Foetidibacter luteolus]